MAVPESVKARGPSPMALQVLINLYRGLSPAAHLLHRRNRSIANLIRRELTSGGFCTGDGEDLVLTDLGREIVEDLLSRSSAPAGKMRNGILLLPVADNAKPVTPEMIKQLQDDLPE